VLSATDSDAKENTFDVSANMEECTGYRDRVQVETAISMLKRRLIMFSNSAFAAMKATKYQLFGNASSVMSSRKHIDGRDPPKYGRFAPLKAL